MDIKKLLNKENPIIFEIGANDGTDTMRLAEMFENPKIHCFEPDPFTFEKLNQHISHLNKNIITNCCALSNYTGEANFYIADNTYSSSLKKPVEHLSVYSFVKFQENKIVKVDTLDNYAKTHKINYCDFVWMDVQGAEDLVIEGGKEFFKRTKYLYTEFSNKELYERAPNKFKILELLPGFEILEVIREWDADGDVLLINKNFYEEVRDAN